MLYLASSIVEAIVIVHRSRCAEWGTGNSIRDLEY